MGTHPPNDKRSQINILEGVCVCHKLKAFGQPEASLPIIYAGDVLNCPLLIWQFNNDPIRERLGIAPEFERRQRCCSFVGNLKTKQELDILN